MGAWLGLEATQGLRLSHSAPGPVPATSPPPTFSRDDVAAHDTPGDLWVTLGGKVYDLTAFLDAHPGGRRNLLGVAGGGADFFVAYWAAHIHSSQFHAVLADGFVGVLEDDNGDVDDDEEDGSPGGSVIVLEPPSALNPSALDASVIALSARLFHARQQPHRRSPALLTTPSGDMSTMPFTAEPTGLFPHQQHTPNEQFFVRNHAPVPRELPRSIGIAVATMVASADTDLATSATTSTATATATATAIADDAISDNSAASMRSRDPLPPLPPPVHTSVQVGLADLEARHGTRRFASTIQCTANRLDERAKVGVDTSTLKWELSNLGGKGWIGNAVWGGVLLVDVLKEHLPPALFESVECAEASGLHVVFKGADGYVLDRTA